MGVVAEKGAATCWAVALIRFVRIDFLSTDPQADPNMSDYRAAAALVMLKGST